MKHVTWWLSIVALLAACKRPSVEAEKAAHAPGTEDAAGEHTDEAEHEELPKRVHLAADVIQASGIKTRPATREVLVTPVDLPGELAADPDRSADVSARIAGRVERVAFREGDLVKKGDLLATIRAPNLGEASSAYAALSAKAAAARSNAARLEALAKSGLASDQEAVTARAEADALDAESRAAGERLHTLGAGSSSTGGALELRAPIGGTIVSRSAIVGQPVTPDQTIASIVDVTEVWFLGRLFEQNLQRVKVGAVAEVSLNAYPDEVFTGTVDYIAPRIDATARTVLARVRLKNDDKRLRLGLFGTAHVAIIEVTDAGAAPTLVVPRSAISDIGDKRYVFVREPDDDFELHEVVVGRSAPGKVEILSGVREGEPVVSDGAFALKSAVLKGTLTEDEE